MIWTIVTGVLVLWAGLWVVRNVMRNRRARFMETLRMAMKATAVDTSTAKAFNQISLRLDVLEKLVNALDVRIGIIEGRLPNECFIASQKDVSVFRAETMNEMDGQDRMIIDMSRRLDRHIKNGKPK